MQKPHIVVAGSGLVGLAVAAKLAQASYRVTLTGETPPPFEPGEYGLRVYALSPASCALLRDIGAWREVERQRVFPYSAMHVWDQEGAGKLDFYATDLGRAELGVIAEDTLLRSVVFARLQKNPQIDICCPARIDRVEENKDVHRVTLSDGRALSADLIVGADGARSWVRRHIGVFWKYTDYRQTAIVATIKHEAPHQNACWQRFYRQSILALLPLSERYGSIVWSCDNALAHRLMHETAEAFEARLQTAFQDKFGVIGLCSKRLAFPLFGGRLDRYVRDGFVLVGDAAHHVHPLAGQGANMGLADAAELAKVLSAGDVPDLPKLRCYERAVKERNLVMKVFLEGLNSIFTEDRALPRKIFCAYGVNTVDRCLPIKTWFMRRALGIGGW